jgi:hypothetical protein
MSFREALINPLFVIPAKAGIQGIQPHGLLASLALRAALRAFNALRAFVRPSPE